MGRDINFSTLSSTMGSPFEDSDGPPSIGNGELTLPWDAPTSSPSAASVLVLVVADCESFAEEKNFVTFVSFDLSRDFEAGALAGEPVTIAGVRSLGNLDSKGP
jgi:hypothetical protein